MFAMENVIPLAYALGHGVILDAYNFGVPQRRRRLFLANFPILPYKKKNLPLGHFFPNIKELRLKRSHESFRMTQRVSGPYDPAFTIARKDIENGLVLILEDGMARDVTIDDLKVLFGFPANFKIGGREKGLMGECVCPPVARHVAKSCLYYMPTFYKIMGGRRWIGLILRPEERLCVQLGLIP